MNEDILKGKWQEIKGRVKENWGRFTDHDLVEVEGKGEKLLGLLRKKYGYIRDKAEPEYQDSVEMAQLVSSIREIMTKNKDFMPFTYIARYWQPLLAKQQENLATEQKDKYGYNTDHYFDSRLRRYTTRLAFQQEPGILSQRSTWIDSSEFDQPAVDGRDLKRV